MEVVKVNSITNSGFAPRQHSVKNNTNVSFKANPFGNSTGGGKKGWYYLRRLADQMKDITEIKNAFIAAIGTGIIAPAIILVSPGKGDKEDKDKKFIQALRQPLSAVLALGFQVPATMIINRYIDKLGYEENLNFFKDDKIGKLIPTEKYLAKKVEKEEIEALEAKFEEVIDGKSLKQELEANIKEECKCAGLEISDEELAKRVKNDKKDFLEKKIAKNKFEKLKEEKIQEILKNPEKYPKIANLQDIDLVTEDYQNWAEQKYKAQYSKLEKDANLSFFDKTMRLMGFETKKTKALDKAQKAFKKEKGLERLKEKSPEIFDDQAKKIRSFINAYQKESEKVFSNKKFWLSLLVNLFMVTASCYALNWMHPRVNKWIENKRAEKEANSQQKVEVK